MLHRSLTVSLALLALATAGCSSSRTAGEAGRTLDRAAVERQSSPVLEILNPHFDVVPTPEGPYALIFSAGASGTSDSPSMRALRSIREVSFVVFDPDGRAIDSMRTTEIPTSGIQNSDGGASLTATARVEWAPGTAPALGTRVLMRATADDGEILRLAEVPPPLANATVRRDRLALSLETEQRGPSTLEFLFTVERTAPAAPEEYLPSGERFRIEIVSETGELQWSSSHGQMFTQAIGPVVPAEVGERAVYRATFDGMSDETHQRLAPGRYRVIATVPAKPRAYVLREELAWGQ
jgi:hypothetical protein